MTNHPSRASETIKVTAIYKHNIGAHTYAAFFTVPRFKTNGVDCDTPEIEAMLIASLREKLLGEARAFHVAGGMSPLSAKVTPGTRVLAFYTDRRAKALIERFDSPIVL